MADETIAFPDLGLIEEVEALLPTLNLPSNAEFRVELAFDYPGQQVAIDLWAGTDERLATIVEAVRDALFLKFRVATRTCSELDREILANRRS
ncbi:MAG TPA: hypothetical protein PLQ19_08205 [Aeromicrobium sp.]|nr:hypothetical protein [Aeromicrobium sp.]